jgi:hypothetical protein
LLSDARFDPTGTRIATASHQGLARVWYVPPAPVPAPGWLPRLAEAVAGIRLGSRGNIELVLMDFLQELKPREGEQPENGFYEKLARWFSTRPQERAPSPF